MAFGGHGDVATGGSQGGVPHICQGGDVEVVERNRTAHAVALRHGTGQGAGFPVVDLVVGHHGAHRHARRGDGGVVAHVCPVVGQADVDRHRRRHAGVRRDVGGRGGAQGPAIEVANGFDLGRTRRTQRDVRAHDGLVVRVHEVHRHSSGHLHVAAAGAGARLAVGVAVARVQAALGTGGVLGFGGGAALVGGEVALIGRFLVGIGRIVVGAILLLAAAAFGAGFGLGLGVDGRCGDHVDEVGATEAVAHLGRGVVHHDVDGNRCPDTHARTSCFTVGQGVDHVGVRGLDLQAAGEGDRAATATAHAAHGVVLRHGDGDAAAHSGAARSTRFGGGVHVAGVGGLDREVVGIAAHGGAVLHFSDGVVERDVDRDRGAHAGVTTLCLGFGRHGVVGAAGGGHVHVASGQCHIAAAAHAGDGVGGGHVDRHRAGHADVAAAGARQGARAEAVRGGRITTHVLHGGAQGEAICRDGAAGADEGLVGHVGHVDGHGHAHAVATAAGLGLAVGVGGGIHVVGCLQGERAGARVVVVHIGPDRQARSNAGARGGLGHVQADGGGHAHVAAAAVGAGALGALLVGLAGFLVGQVGLFGGLVVGLVVT